jgi:hypothetical protein
MNILHTNKKNLMIGGGILVALLIALYIKNKNKNSCKQKNNRGQCVNPKKYTLKENYTTTISKNSGVGVDCGVGCAHSDTPDVTTEKLFKSGDTIVGYLTTDIYPADLGNANEIFVITKVDGTEPNINWQLFGNGNDNEVFAYIPLEVLTERKNFVNYVDTTKNQYFQPEFNTRW